MFQGTPEGDLTDGEFAVEMMNLVGYDAMVLGNHEFDRGKGVLAKLIRQAEFPFLSANLRHNQEQFTGIDNYLILERKGIRFGILGLTTKRTPEMSLPKNMRGFSFLDEVKTARTILGMLRDRGADILIALTHMGIEREAGDFEGDRWLAKEVPELDLILGGHTHTALPKGKWISKTKTLITQTHGKGTEVGILHLWVNRFSKRPFGYKTKLISLFLPQYGEDEEVKEIAEIYRAQVSEIMDVEIGAAAVSLERPTRQNPGESALGNWQTDLMRRFSQTDLAFQNAGGIRSNLEKGLLTIRDIYRLSPFGNTLITMELTGEEILTMLEQSVSGSFGILQISGTRMTYDSTRKKGERLIFADIEPAKTYSVITNSFLSSGGDGFKVFLNGRNITDTGKLLRDIEIEEVKQNSPISAKLDGRIQDVSGPKVLQGLMPKKEKQ